MISTQVQLRWNDMDMLGHLYNGKYQSIFDVGMSEYLSKEMGIVYNENDLWPLKASITINYLRQVHFDHPLAVHTAIESVGNKSMTFVQQLIRTDTQELMADCHTVVVCFDMCNHVSVRVPDIWRNVAAGENATAKK